MTYGSCEGMQLSQKPSTLPPYPRTQKSGIPWLGEIPAHWEIVPGFAAYRPKQVKNTGLVENQVLSLS